MAGFPSGVNKCHSDNFFGNGSRRYGVTPDGPREQAAAIRKITGTKRRIANVEHIELS